jgi:hypothetical protein
MPEPLGPTDYELDHDDRIRAVSTTWLTFAQHNGASDLHPDRVIGRPIWDFVTGTDVQEVYKAIFTRVRTREQPISVPFRCDSPDCRRYMQLTVASAPKDGLALSATLLREEPRDRVAVLDREASRSDELVPMCSWCKAVRVAPGEWLQVEEAAERLHLLDAVSLPRLTHTICPACDAHLDESMGHHNAA